MSQSLNTAGLESIKVLSIAEKVRCICTERVDSFVGRCS